MVSVTLITRNPSEYDTMFNLDHAKRIVIISAEQAGKSEAANANASAELASHLALDLAAGVIDSIIQCDGQYKGAPERSFLAICDREAVPMLATTAARFSQECILVVRTLPATGRTVGSLQFPDGGRERIGELAPCEPGQEYEASTTLHGTGIAFHFA